jgi:hypothetical protein
MNKLVIGLGAATVCALLVLLGFLAGSGWKKGAAPADDKDGEKGKVEAVKNPGDAGTSRRELPDPPPPPPPVLDQVRVRESLKPGRTYRVITRLAFNMRGTDHDWAVLNSVITVNYMADAEVERKIESNDGKTIVELRTFKRVFSGKLNTDLESVRIDLGPAGDFLIGGVTAFRPEALPVVAGARQLIEGPNFSNLLKITGLGQSFLDDMVNRDPRIRAVTSMGGLQGKTVRLVYKNDEEGDVQVVPVEGALTTDEQRFLASSVLLSDSLIFPDARVEKGDTWEADSMYFIGLIDPSLMARPEGKLRLARGPDILPPARSGQRQKCVQINVVGGELNFRESNRKAEQVGFFRPQKGEMVFSPQDQIFILADLIGRGKLTVRSRDHILFEARSDREPEMKIHYECTLLGESGE